MPQNFTQQDRQNLLNHLGIGRSNAISATSLSNLIGFNARSNQIRLRSLTKECIEQDGDLIGAVTGRPAGYFMISNVSELNRYLDSLESRIRSDNDRRNALINNWNQNNRLPQSLF